MYQCCKPQVALGSNAIVSLKRVLSISSSSHLISFFHNPIMNPFFSVLFLTFNFVCCLLNLLFIYFTDFGYPSFPKEWPCTSGKGKSGPGFTLFQISRKTFASYSKLAQNKLKLVFSLKCPFS